MKLSTSKQLPAEVIEAVECLDTYMRDELEYHLNECGKGKPRCAREAWDAIVRYLDPDGSITRDFDAGRRPNGLAWLKSEEGERWLETADHLEMSQRQLFLIKGEWDAAAQEEYDIIEAAIRGETAEEYQLTHPNPARACADVIAKRNYVVPAECAAGAFPSK